MTTVLLLSYEELMRMGDFAGVRIRHLRGEGGFTLVELLVVVIVIGVLIGIAVPAYLAHRERANDVGAGASVRQAMPSIEAYFEENGTYVGMTPAGLRAAYDSSLHESLVVADATATGYCVQATFGGRTRSLVAGGSIVPGAC